jgi:hypothetical protein
MASVWPAAPAISDLVISRGSTKPYTYKAPYGGFPSGTEAWIRITDRAKQELAILDGDVTVKEATFLLDPLDLDPIPNGANFELFVTSPDGDDYKARYGRVIVSDVMYPLHPESVDTFTPKTFSGDFPNTAALTEYVIRSGKIRILDNPGSLPNGLGPNFPLFYTNAACLHYEPVNGDSIRFNFNIVFGTGQTRFVVCSNYEMTNYLAVEFDTVDFTDHIVIGTGTSPLVMVEQTAHVPTTFADMQNYTIYYNFLTNTISVYKGTDLTPIVEWEDETGIVQHGEGHRYFGFTWLGSLLDDGIQPVSWIIRDDP